MLRTNLHYHPNGTPQVDRTRIGLYFGKGEIEEGSRRRRSPATCCSRFRRTRANHELRAVYVADQDINIVSFFPHMHLRGHDMTMTATFPGGTQETLLSVPAYDFNWQLFYYPKHNGARCRKGTRSTRRALRQLGAQQAQSRSDQAGHASARRRRRDDVRDVRVHRGRRRQPEAVDRADADDGAAVVVPEERSAFLIEVPFGKNADARRCSTCRAPATARRSTGRRSVR